MNPKKFFSTILHTHHTLPVTPFKGTVSVNSIDPTCKDGKAYL